MEFWMGVAMTLLVESVILMFARAWLRRKTEDLKRDKGRTQA